MILYIRDCLICKRWWLYLCLYFQFPISNVFVYFRNLLILYMGDCLICRKWWLYLFICLFQISVLLWFECERSPTSSCVYTTASQLVATFWVMLDWLVKVGQWYRTFRAMAKSCFQSRLCFLICQTEGSFCHMVPLLWPLSCLSPVTEWTHEPLSICLPLSCFSLVFCYSSAEPLTKGPFLFHCLHSSPTSLSWNLYQANTNMLAFFLVLKWKHSVFHHQIWC